MLRKTSIVFTLCCAIVLAQDLNQSKIPIQPAVSTVGPITPPSTSSTTPSSTTKATTPAATTTSTTSTTTSPPTTSTSPAPTTEPSTTTTTLAPPTKSHYVVKNGNDTCIIAELAVQVMLSIDNKTQELDVPANISSSGTFKNETQELGLSWEDKGKNMSFRLTIQFTKNDTSKTVVVSQMNLYVTQPNSTLNLTDSEPMFSTSLSKSYKCEKEQQIKLAEEGMNTTFAVLKISHLQLEAFHTATDEKFSAAEDCASSSSPDIVPIAVGCALVGLIVIVLVAYLVGRRRSQARGYLSM